MKGIEMIGKFDDIIADLIKFVPESIVFKKHITYNPGNCFENEPITNPCSPKSKLFSKINIYFIFINTRMLRMSTKLK